MPVRLALCSRSFPGKFLQFDVPCSFWWTLAILTFMIVFSTLMVIVSVLSVFKVFHTMAIDFSFYANGDSQPITLGRPQADVDSRRDPISISA